jgi:hypothetical protein
MRFHCGNQLCGLRHGIKLKKVEQYRMAIPLAVKIIAFVYTKPISLEDVKACHMNMLRR